jgi:hypothetical protein
MPRNRTGNRTRLTKPPGKDGAAKQTAESAITTISDRSEYCP